MTPQQRIAEAKAREDKMAEAGRRLQAVLSSPGAVVQKLEPTPEPEPTPEAKATQAKTAKAKRSAPANKSEKLILPPFSIEAEQAVLGSLMSDRAAYSRIREMVSEDDFYRADHRLLWRHITRLIDGNRMAHDIAVGKSLENAGELAAAGGQDYVTALLVRHSVPKHVSREKAKVIRECSEKRKLIEAAVTIGFGAFNGKDVELAQAKKGSVSRLGIIEIDDDIPLKRQFAGKDKFPFRNLELGQSFFVPTGPERKTFSSVHHYNEILAPKKFTSRKWTQPDGAAGFRVWRVE